MFPNQITKFKKETKNKCKENLAYGQTKFKIYYESSNGILQASH